ncbi:uncharacterized protein LOC130053559 [Ostrea edulis]|uniref:uncharacterized protein LOC130053559 n=1 Tax=Ostrea edulis TaxID=37623 RepID=UPI0024AFBB5F|nr:uncharacterized protein LOC130053559 [Ostrea edulis]
MPRKRQTSDQPPKRGRRQDGQALPPPDPQPVKGKSQQSMETPQYPSHSQLSLPAPLQGTEDHQNLQIPQQHIQTISLQTSQGHQSSQLLGEVDTELWLPKPYITSQTTQKCFDYNFRGICTKIQCHYSHSCTRCSGLHPQVNCNPNKPQFYTPYGQKSGQSSYRRPSPIYTSSNHHAGFQNQQQYWKQQSPQPHKFSNAGNQKHGN